MTAIAIDQPGSAYLRRRSRDRRTFWILLIITVLGLVWRLSFASNVNWSKPDNVSRLVGDEPGYDMFATDLLEGKFFIYPFRTPVYPMFLAAVYWCFGHSPAAVLVVQSVLSAAAIPLTYWLGRYVTGRGASLIAAAMVAAHYELVWISNKLYSETVFTALLLLSVITFYRAIHRPTVWRWSVSGVLLGVLNLCRPTGGLMPIAMFFGLPWRWKLSKKVRSIFIYGLAMLLPIIPWTIHNWRQYHVFMPFSLSIANLYHGSPEFYNELQKGKTVLDMWFGGPLDPKANGGHSAHTFEGDKYFHDRAIKSIKAEPGVWFIYCVKKAGYVWFGNPAIDWPWAYRQYYGKGRQIGVLITRLYVPGAVVAIAWLWWRKKLRRFLPLFMIAAYFTAVHAVMYSESRYGHPMAPFLSLLMGAMLVDLKRWYFERRADRKTSREQLAIA